jgi:hypothetical protein
VFKAQNKLSKYWENTVFKLINKLITGLNYFKIIKLGKEPMLVIF